ncbi:hypothetical protein CY34DRAFT_466637 [Suillus luteus UH-Slu-Lm8-n1]|uniref:Uncharacterized protein n=1 Tax=Suillus luteus UH-Slu-Lm8-n1 TaxID=930992 RepID=A0A0D0B8E5_9AGAM|nr:hypothetical protein CY34DRAFT_466637 [Suillus luteus UH-Slu-Lm8-n1]
MSKRTVFDPKGFQVQAQSSGRGKTIHNCGLILVTGEGMYCLSNHQKCENR